MNPYPDSPDPSAGDLELRTEDTEEAAAEVVADTEELSAQEARKADQAAAKAERDAA